MTSRSDRVICRTGEALELVHAAADRFVDNAERREWVVHILMKRMHMSESIARMTLEIAVQIYKEEHRRVEVGR